MADPALLGAFASGGRVDVGGKWRGSDLLTFKGREQSQCQTRYVIGREQQ